MLKWKTVMLNCNNDSSNKCSLDGHNRHSNILIIPHCLTNFKRFSLQSFSVVFVTAAELL